MPVANIAPPTSGVAAPPVIRPTPVPVSQSVQPIGPLDRAPGNVNASTDPELPQPQSVPRVKVRRMIIQNSKRGVITSLLSKEIMNYE